MAKDFAFMFYPGDYLRDTQCLSEKAQVAYDRIMCEHMRNISSTMNNITVSREKVNFFMKRLNEEEKAELFHVLTEQSTGFQIEWVSISICKRKSYSDSRSENRKKKLPKDMNNTSSVMVNENEFNTIIDLNWGKESTDFLKDKTWVEQFCMQKGLQKKELEKSMKHFVTTMTLQEDWKTCVELKRHYTNYYNKHGLNGAIKSASDMNELEANRVTDYFDK